MGYQQLKGTGVALITPFQKNGSIDFPALEKLTGNLLRTGVDFLVALGTTAETSTLSMSERQEVLNAVVGYVNGQVPVICGIGGNNTNEVVDQLKTMDLQGVDTILTVVPYYNKPTQEGMYQHFKTIAEATNKQIILYNVPARTGSNILPETVLRLAADCKNIIGIKEANGNIVQNMELLKNKPDNFTVLSGDDNLALAQMALGMEGVISVAANCFTKEITDIINLAIVGKFDKARKVLYRMLPGIDLLFADGNPPGVKYVLSKQGVCNNIFRLPVVPVSEETAKKIDSFLN